MEPATVELSVTRKLCREAAVAAAAHASSRPSEERALDVSKQHGPAPLWIHVRPA
jgi:hypothetical protein